MNFEDTLTFDNHFGAQNYLYVVEFAMGAMVVHVLDPLVQKTVLTLTLLNIVLYHKILCWSSTHVGTFLHT